MKCSQGGYVLGMRIHRLVDTLPAEEVVRVAGASY
jgi:hypothetical protein